VPVRLPRERGTPDRDSPAPAIIVSQEFSMSFSFPDLPYAHDALAPHMSKETLEYHHDKHQSARF
jgi:hypothetical protein